MGESRAGAPWDQKKMGQGDWLKSSQMIKPKGRISSLSTWEGAQKCNVGSQSLETQKVTRILWGTELWMSFFPWGNWRCIFSWESKFPDENKCSLLVLLGCPRLLLSEKWPATALQPYSTFLSTLGRNMVMGHCLCGPLNRLSGYSCLTISNLVFSVPLWCEFSFPCWAQSPTMSFLAHYREDDIDSGSIPSFISQELTEKWNILAGQNSFSTYFILLVLT